MPRFDVPNQTSLFPKRRRRPRLETIPPLEPPTQDQKNAKWACYVRGQFITFSRGDGNELTKLPPNTHDANDPPPGINGHVDFFYLLPRNHRSAMWWKRKIGNYIAAKILLIPGAIRRERNYYITDFPEFYTLLQHRKGPWASPRTDCYLFGCRNVLRFRSPEEFYPHVRWMLTKKENGKERANCACVYCTNRRRRMREKFNVRERRENEGILTQRNR